MSRHRSAACVHGHEYTPENTISRADGRHMCRTCEHARYLRKRGEEPEPPVQLDDEPWLWLLAAITRQACDDFARDGADDESATSYLSACGLIRDNGRLHRRLAARSTL